MEEKRAKEKEIGESRTHASGTLSADEIGSLSNDGHIQPWFASIASSTGNTLLAQNPTPASIARQRFNQVFVKVLMPVTARTPKQDGPVVEAWVAEQLKQSGESEYFAVTNWVPVCDALLEGDKVDNRVWGGSLGNASFCPVGGDIPERKDGRVLVSVAGWAPAAGYEARVTMADESGNRIVEPVRVYSASGEKLQVQNKKPMAYVAILIGPPPHEGHTAMPNKKNK